MKRTKNNKKYTIQALRRRLLGTHVEHVLRESTSLFVNQSVTPVYCIATCLMIDSLSKKTDILNFVIAEFEHSYAWGFIFLTFILVLGSALGNSLVPFLHSFKEAHKNYKLCLKKGARVRLTVHAFRFCLF